MASTNLTPNGKGTYNENMGFSASGFRFTHQCVRAYCHTSHSAECSSNSNLSLGNFSLWMRMAFWHGYPDMDGDECDGSLLPRYQRFGWHGACRSWWIIYPGASSLGRNIHGYIADCRERDGHILPDLRRCWTGSERNV
jgi:hypothetical protein